MDLERDGEREQETEQERQRGERDIIETNREGRVQTRKRDRGQKEE